MKQNRLCEAAFLIFFIHPLAAGAAASDATEARTALAKLGQEPTVHEVIQAALERAHLDGDQLNDLRNQAQWKSALPKLETRYRNNGTSVDLGKWDYINFPDRKAGQDLVSYRVWEIEVSGQWDLPRLVFNNELLEVNALFLQQQKLIEDVISLYYARRRLQIEMLLETADTATSRLSKELRQEELTARIDSLTDGFFSRSLAQKKSNSAPSSASNRP